MEYSWNPWHGCHKISPGCLNCYVYRIDEKYEKDSSIISKNSNFNFPIRKNRKKEYKIPNVSLIYTCFSSDFFLDDEDVNKWREAAWKIIKERKDCNFLIVTKRIANFSKMIPDDWEDGYDNVIIYSTVENQNMADFRLPYLKKAKIKHKGIVCEPLLEEINLEQYLDNSIIDLLVGGESGPKARVCNYDWVLNLKNQCDKKNVKFVFRQTGANFLKDGKLYKIARKYQFKQAKKSHLDT